MASQGEHSAHYRQDGLEAALLAALTAAGKDVDHLRPDDLAGADEFHIGGAMATRELAGQLDLRPGMRLLDIGSGLGGPARHLAAAHGCRVTGIDLTEGFVAIANGLTRRMGMEDAVAFRLANADRLEFDDASFDGVLLLHVGMNIADKAGAFAAVHRVLKPGGFFAVYDIMRVGAGELVFPLPWATGPGTSFVVAPEAYRAALVAAGFTVAPERDRSAAAVAFFAAQQARRERGEAAPLGLGMVMGASAPQKLGNVAGLIRQGVLAPVEMIARKAAA
jgi:SAM-dependent methyltransferase